jgi:hypothetical protein
MRSASQRGVRLGVAACGRSRELRKCLTWASRCRCKKEEEAKEEEKTENNHRYRNNAQTTERAESQSQTLLTLAILTVRRSPPDSRSSSRSTNDSVVWPLADAASNVVEIAASRAAAALPLPLPAPVPAPAPAPASEASPALRSCRISPVPRPKALEMGADVFVLLFAAFCSLFLRFASSALRWRATQQPTHQTGLESNRAHPIPSHPIASHPISSPIIIIASHQLKSGTVRGSTHLSLRQERLLCQLRLLLSEELLRSL